MKFLNPDFDLKTFYWMYVKAEGGVVTYTVECFDTRKGHDHCNGPFMVITTSIGTDVVYECRDLGPTDGDDILDARVLDAVRKHFNLEFMLSDGRTMSAEYCCGASGVLHKDPVHGQAIFGMDLEEAYDMSDSSAVA